MEDGNPSDADSDDGLGTPQAPWMRMAGLGMELASYTLGLAAIGYVVDSRRGHARPYATAAAALVGFSFGMFRFIQKATGGR